MFILKTILKKIQETKNKIRREKIKKYIIKPKRIAYITCFMLKYKEE